MRSVIERGEFAGLKRLEGGFLRFDSGVNAVFDFGELRAVEEHSGMLEHGLSGLAAGVGRHWEWDDGVSGIAGVVAGFLGAGNERRGGDQDESESFLHCSNIQMLRN